MTSEHPFVYEKPITTLVRNEAWKSRQISFARLNRNLPHLPPFWFDSMCGKLHSLHSTLLKIWHTSSDWWKLTMALTSWTRLRTEYIRREREGSERDCERPRTSENQATPCKVIEDSLGSWIPGVGFRIPCQWNLDSRFQSLAGFRIPWAEFRIPKRLSGIYKQNL